MDRRLRDHLIRALDWDQAHVPFDKAIEGVPDVKRGQSAPGFEHTLWQLLEHMRIAQKDLLDFCVNAHYVHMLKWPEEYWPTTPAPASDSAWNQSIADFKADREKLKALVRDMKDVFAVVPTGEKTHTYLRGILVIVDHNTYHLGQLVAVRKALGIWP
jgi:hypothetical protein